MDYVVLFIFYVMVAILTIDMTRMLDRRPRQMQPRPIRPRTSSSTQMPLVASYGRLLRSKRAAC
jgi:hypothetical protein